MSAVEVSVGAARLERWVENFSARHGSTRLGASSGELTGSAGDGSTFRVRLPFGQEYAGPADLALVLERCQAPAAWGLLLVRKGGFAIARLAGERMVDSKVGRRHVQGRTKAGGQSQQRFARRRDNQARVAYEAAAEHAARILGGLPTQAPVVTGGDHTAVDSVLGDRRLVAVSVVPPFLTVPDPRRSVLEAAVAEAGAVRISVTNTEV